MVNKVILVGNVGKDPEVRYFDNDQAVANFPLATTERGFKTRDGQEVPDRTEWHNIVAWRGLAKIAESYIKKGTQLYVEGRIRTRSYDDANGVKKYMTEIYADTINLLGRRNSGDNDQATRADQPMQHASLNQQSAAQNNLSNSSDQGSFNAGDSGPEDDLPF
ncbi:single-stranded DNA-binding protein [Natronoflexus pectinivorans]|uniref:Single-stranded DNA-binding protein n=1 Tax=Natronoflexus pectinivorans TaxID=682526 RepID=A0A4R2GQT7_9BACT|nr:single-stranded DNA-binding protein [Natronoflexus pectinivorans]TCO10476.1 single-strand DNA-binding protein [Natronoflexus pectinivorans]